MTEFWSISVSTYGIKKRCRKSDRHFESQLLELPLETPKDELESKANAAAKTWVTANMKTVERPIMVHAAVHYTEPTDGTYSITGFRMFDERNLKWQVMS